jgi:hypothetical protein
MNAPTECDTLRKQPSLWTEPNGLRTLKTNVMNVAEVAHITTL